MADAEEDAKAAYPVLWEGKECTLVIGVDRLGLRSSTAVLHVILLRDVVNTQLQGGSEITVRSLGQAIWSHMEGCTTSCFGAGPVVTTLRVGVRGTTDPNTVLQTVDAAAGLLPSADRRRRFALMVNPTSGSKSALKRLRDTVDPVLTAASVEYTVFETSARGDGRRFAASLDEVTGYAGIIIMGGDGTCTEIHSGNMENLRLPLAILPVGSDNSMAYTLGMRNLAEGLLAIVKGPCIPIDTSAVFELDTATDTVSDKPLVYPMCCIAFGMAADILLDIEAARFLGPARTTICALKRLLYDGAVPYRWKVRYRSPPHACTKCGVPERRQCDDCDRGVSKYHPKEALQDHPFNTMSQLVLGVHRAKSMAAMPDGCFFPLGHFSDGLMDASSVAYSNGTRTILSHLPNVLRGKVAFDSPTMHYFKATEVVVERDHNLGWNLGVDGDVFRPRTDAVLLRVIPHAAKMFTFREEVPAAERSFASQLKSMLGMLSSPEDAAMLHV